ncbi:hypothetical protein [Sporomusa sp.]|jgi:hypothetical protein|uniref:hypothetical protein n=1 Tax=Sporomusa sp. TaxID=2078658 RepID=UPI002974F470|nr:hypothetical protein [Sporomusa sp.]MDF2571521.1 hypothetical protein [Sporomusa sp.]HWR07408.1 hypothetical protein [Sporomusa sp.]
MYVEKRKNGTFYLKESVYNPKTKLPKNTSVYLGSNPIQAKEKLRSLTEDLVILAQIPDINPYELELNMAIKELQKLNQFTAKGVSRLITEYLNELMNAKQFIITAQNGSVALTADCIGCLFKKANHCCHFDLNFSGRQDRYATGKQTRCVAWELGKSELTKGSIKLPREFRER